MKMFQVEIKSEGDLIIITQESDGNKDVVVLHRDQAPLVGQWLKDEYCSYRNAEVQVPE